MAHPFDPFTRINPTPVTRPHRDAFDQAEHVGAQQRGLGQFVGQVINGHHVRIIVVLMITVLFILIGRAAHLQLLNGTHYSDLAQGNRIKINHLRAQRGIIYDRAGRQLVENIPIYNLYLSVNDIPRGNQRDQVLQNVANLLGHSSTTSLVELMQSNATSYIPVLVAENITSDQAMLWDINQNQYPGTQVEVDYARRYMIEGSLSHILGYTGKISTEEYIADAEHRYLYNDQVGKTGIEFSFEKDLRGLHGIEEVEVDALGSVKRLIEESHQQSGRNIMLTVDAALQTEIEHILVRHLSTHEKRRAAVVAMDPRNGEILALVSWPAYNNNAFTFNRDSQYIQAVSQHEDRPLFNRAIAGQYPSGSTIKMIVAAAALNENVITENTTVVSTGGIRVGEWFFGDWRAGGHGVTNVTKAIAQSVNTFFYYIGGGYNQFTGLGVDRLIDYYRRFKLGTATGIDLPGETGGFVPSPAWKQDNRGERWYIGDTYNISIGQGDVLVSPLQVAAVTSYFANGGTFYQPHTLKGFFTLGQQVLIEQPVPISGTEIVSQSATNIVRRGLRETVLTGSARRLQSAIVTSAGKTGTAQWSSTKDNHAWFTGFAPYDDPKIVITILVEEGEGGDIISVPIFQDIINWYFRSPRP